jgi:hypothetical protein
VRCATKVKIFKLVPGMCPLKGALCNESKLPDFVALRSIPRFCLENSFSKKDRGRDSLKMLCATKKKRFKVVRYIADSSKVLYATKVNSPFSLHFAMFPRLFLEVSVKMLHATKIKMFTAGSRSA